MESDTKALPDWLTEETINGFKADLAACPNPYTQEEVSQLWVDVPWDMPRFDAFVAKKILTEYGLI